MAGAASPGGDAQARNILTSRRKARVSGSVRDAPPRMRLQGPPNAFIGLGGSEHRPCGLRFKRRRLQAWLPLEADKHRLVCLLRESA